MIVVDRGHGTGTGQKARDGGTEVRTVPKRLKTAVSLHTETGLLLPT